MLDLPFPVGTTYKSGNSNITVPTDLEGKIYEVEDRDYSVTTGVKPFRSRRRRKLMVVRNASGITLLGKRLASLQKSGAYFIGRVDGYCATTAQADCVPIDEFLPSTGCPDGDLCYVVVHGEAKVTMSAATATDIVYGDRVVASTAAASTGGSTHATAGRCEKQVLTGATQVLADQIQNVVGKSLSNKTAASSTNGTNTDVLLLIEKY